MANNIVAYIGIDNFDLILYQARILSKIGRKVLIIEKDNMGSISHLFPKPLDFDSSKEPFTYKRIDYTTTDLTKELSEIYDDIFICYGFQKIINGMHSRVVLVSDLYLHNLERVKELLDQIPSNKNLLIKNNAGLAVNKGIEVAWMEGKIKAGEIDIIDYSEEDLFNAVMCQHSQNFSFTRLSRGLKKYLLKETKRFCPDITDHIILVAYKSAKRGV